MATGVCIAAPLHGDRSGRLEARARGFSLIEMMVVLGIMAIIMAVALPAFSAWRESTALQSASESLMAHIKQARVMAISGNRSVSVAFATNSYTVDVGGSKQQQYQLGEYSKNLTVTAAFYHPPSATPNTTLSFASDGTASAGSVSIKNLKGTTKQIQVNIVGRSYYN